jgi:hypothetical protein
MDALTEVAVAATELLDTARRDLLSSSNSQMAQQQWFNDYTKVRSQR